MLSSQRVKSVLAPAPPACAAWILLFGGLFVGYGIIHGKFPEAFMAAHKFGLTRQAWERWGFLSC